MFTIVIIAHNQEEKFKKNLSQINNYIDSETNHILIVNNGSTDNTKDYLQTIYPHINCIHHYEMISETEALNNILHLIKTPYFFLYDIAIEMRSIELEHMCKNVLEKNNVLGIFSILQSHQITVSRYYPITLNYFHECMHIDFENHIQKNTISISPIMLIRTIDLKRMNGLSVTYKSFLFSWFDFSIKCFKKGLHHNYFDTVSLHKEKNPTNTFYNDDKQDYFHDSLLLQLNHFNTVRFKITRLIKLIFYCLAFKPKKCFFTIQAYISYFFIQKNKTLNWTIRTENDIILKRNISKKNQCYERLF